MSSQQSISFALMQLEQSLNNLQNGLFDEEGRLVPDERWFAIYDDLLAQVVSARAVADASNRKPLTNIDWKKVSELIEA